MIRSQRRMTELSVRARIGAQPIREPTNPVGDDVRRLSICLGARKVRPTEEVRVSSPRLLQMETKRPWLSASRQRPPPRVFGAFADEESAVLTNTLGMHRNRPLTLMADR